MQRTLFLFILFASQIHLFASDYDFSALQGLKDKKGNTYFEFSGYDIYCSSMKGKLNDSKAINQLKKRYKIKDIQADYSDPKLSLPNRIIESEQPVEKNPSLKYNAVFYLFAKSQNEIEYIVFQTLNQRDILFEKEFINAFLEKKLTGYISDNKIDESISFAGRIVKLGTACVWRGPHNLYCRGGQISWSEFSSAESAEFDLDMRIAANSEGPYKILSKDYIEILFEDIPTVACRIAYLGKNDNYPLIVYYVTQEVRGRYVSCVMSNYGNNRNDYELTPLLQQFMSIPSPPDWADNSFDIPEIENNTNRTFNLYRTDIELSLGSVFPLGSLNHVFQFAPSFNLFFCFPIKQNKSIDVGVLGCIPVKSRMFDYTYKGETFETKANSIFCGDLRYSYLYAVDKNVSFKSYLGIGISSLKTNTVKEIDEDNNKIYYTVNALDILAGIQMKYKKLGCSIEYHRVPFSNSSKVANDFGNSMLYVGFSYFFQSSW